MESLFLKSEHIVYMEVHGNPVYDLNGDEVEKDLSEIYGSPIFDLYDGVDPIFDDPIVSIFDEVEFVIDVCAQDAKTIDFVFGDKAFDTFLNVTCSNALAKESLHKFAMKFKRRRRQLIMSRAVIVSWQTKRFNTNDQYTRWLEEFYI
ncbi:hypothetical protein F2Q69_00003061 [Brassica cretica]|uniref:Uncharacterized protein n=1 Tax=Brassica cretica TaxID=69181 RepID=A0A8S9PDC5_BRACR|nr:hypothetical protein F2Q69_00003061 [Brassica cretica]